MQYKASTKIRQLGRKEANQQTLERCLQAERQKVFNTSQEPATEPRAAHNEEAPMAQRLRELQSPPLPSAVHSLHVLNNLRQPGSISKTENWIYVFRSSYMVKQISDAADVKENCSPP